ncbi:MAG: GNAT family N-acetyltransferase [Candidatus Woesearchaeota archaeon]
MLDNPKYSRLLLNKVEEWLKNKNVNKIVGPINSSLENYTGFQLKGFNQISTPSLTYTKKYYIKHMRKNNYNHIKKLNAYIINLDEFNVSTLKPLHNNIRTNIRPLNIKEFDIESRSILDIINNSFPDDYFGFRKINIDEWKFLIESLRPLINPEDILIYEENKKPIGVLFSIPNINIILRTIKLKNDFIRKLLLFFRKNSISMRVISLICIKRNNTQKGIGSYLMSAYITQAKKRGIKNIEYSWVYDDNQVSKSLINRFNGRKYKIYQLFQKTLVKNHK